MKAKMYYLGVRKKITEQIKQVEDRLEYCNKEIKEGRYDTFINEIRTLEGKLEGLKIALNIIGN